MGDVALTVPVVKEVLAQNPDIEITFVSAAFLAPFFEGIERLHFFPAQLKTTHKGPKGIYKLYREISKKRKIDMVIDLHSVMRSWLMGAFARMSGIPTYRIDKGRKEKKNLVSKERKVRKQLPHSTERYLKVFEAAGLKVKSLTNDPWIKAKPSTEIENLLAALELHNKNSTWIGFAPFAMHAGKMWPSHHAKQWIKEASKNAQIFLFGGKGEVEALSQLAEKLPQVHILAGKLSLKDELTFMSRLDVMVAMDSSNMHMATLVGTPVVSIWGATHTDAGFGPLGDNRRHIVEISTAELACRPCSIFGNKPCWRGDLACLEQITPKMVHEKVIGITKV